MTRFSAVRPLPAARASTERRSARGARAGARARRAPSDGAATGRMQTPRVLDSVAMVHKHARRARNAGEKRRERMSARSSRTSHDGRASHSPRGARAPERRGRDPRRRAAKREPRGERASALTPPPHPSSIPPRSDSPPPLGSHSRPARLRPGGGAIRGAKKKRAKPSARRPGGRARGSGQNAPRKPDAPSFNPRGAFDRGEHARRRIAAQEA